jgi:hypothetical protein
VLFNQYNTPVHKSIKTTATLHELGYELHPHPPYSPHLAPSDFSLFANFKRMLAAKKFLAKITAIIVVSPSKAQIRLIAGIYNSSIE